MMKEADRFVDISTKLRELLDDMQNTNKIDTNNVYDLMLLQREIRKELINISDNNEIIEGYRGILNSIDNVLKSLDTEKIEKHKVKSHNTLNNRYKNIRDYTKSREKALKLMAKLSYCALGILYLLLFFAIMFITGFGQYAMTYIYASGAIIIALIVFLELPADNINMNRHYVKVSNKDKIATAEALCNNICTAYFDRALKGETIYELDKDIREKLYTLKSSMNNSDNLISKINCCIDITELYENEICNSNEDIKAIIES